MWPPEPVECPQRNPGMVAAMVRDAMALLLLMMLGKVGTRGRGSGSAFRRESEVEEERRVQVPWILPGGVPCVMISSVRRCKSWVGREW